MRVGVRGLRGHGRGADARLSPRQQRKTGAPGAIYYYFGNQLRVGAGYNFANFSDDLTDLSYDHRGAFFSIVGSM